MWGAARSRVGLGWIAGVVRSALLIASVTLGAASAGSQEAAPRMPETPVRGGDETLDEATDFVPQQPSALAQFTTAVENREPIDQVTFVPNSVRTITFFSDLRGLQGQTVIHRWIYGGETQAEVPFEVRGPRWRVWSRKDLLEDWVGDWTVEIVTANGEVLAAETFTYSGPGA